MEVRNQSLWSVIILGLGWVVGGCAPFSKEATVDMDFVYGPDYVAKVDRQGVEKPHRLLILPIRGVLSSAEATDFLRNFQTALQDPTVLIQDSDLTGSLLEPNPDAPAIRAKAESLGCEGILLLEIKDFRQYQPLCVVSEAILENIRGDTLMRIQGNYDAQDRTVANSARRYYEKELQKTVDPSRSMAILQRKQLFLKFVAHHLARSLVFQLAPVTK